MTITILDGGISRELETIGAPFRQPEWSALALIEAPHLVGEVHALFAQAGAQVISTNSYAVVPFHIGEARFAAEGAMLAARAGAVARTVADRSGIKVAGSLPPVLGSYRPDLFDADVARPILETLIEGLSPHVDIWLAETQSALAEATLVVETLRDDTRPLWLSFTLDDDSGTLRSGESVAAAAQLVKDFGATAILFNCSRPEVMDTAVREAAAILSGTAIAIGVYANGFAAPADDDSANEVISELRADLTPAHYLGWAKQWVASGATMVGGCCGISPAHIAALAEGFSTAG
jgi:S-methylmethionine-dependent homocysteine/selenocysteine methylase